MACCSCALWLPRLLGLCALLFRWACGRWPLLGRAAAPLTTTLPRSAGDARRLAHVRHRFTTSTLPVACSCPHTRYCYNALFTTPSCAFLYRLRLRTGRFASAGGWTGKGGFWTNARALQPHHLSRDAPAHAYRYHSAAAPRPAFTAAGSIASVCTAQVGTRGFSCLISFCYRSGRAGQWPDCSRVLPFYPSACGLRSSGLRLQMGGRSLCLWQFPHRLLHCLHWAPPPPSPCHA